MKIELIKLDELLIHEHHLSITYSASQFKFSTNIFYHDVSFTELIEKYSRSLIDRITSHIALFEGMKFCSLFPEYYDISLIAEQLSSGALELFTRIYMGVFAQHQYENQVTDYLGPKIIFPGKELGEGQPDEIFGDGQTVLTGCGGGKDSVLAMRMLQEANIPFSSMQYSHSAYGKADSQHALIFEVLACVSPVKKHRISIYETFSDYPFLPLYYPENSGVTAPETPVSVFESLIPALYWGYNYLNLAHEKSADTGNFYWQETQREVNHQWGKSFEAETLVNHFIQDNLLSNFTYFSILKPIYDFRIFKNLARDPEILGKIHSCNIQKPWCKKCAKCAYVWLGLMAAFPTEQVNPIFQKNFFDDQDLLFIFKQMLGLTEHTPFECIGEIDESRLYMKKCLEKGLSGKVLALFQRTILTDNSINWQEIEQKYDRVYETDHSIPDWIFDKIRVHL